MLVMFASGSTTLSRLAPVELQVNWDVALAGLLIEDKRKLAS
jgi:hypothetical protein